MGAAALAAALLLAGCGAGSAASSAQYPTKTMTLVSSTGAGGGSDVFGREFAKLIQQEKLSPQPTFVLDKPGGSGEVAINFLMQHKSSSYYLWIVPGPVLLSNVAKGRIRLSDLKQVCIVGFDENVVVVPEHSRFKTLRQLIAAAKAKPKSITLAGGAVGDAADLAARLLGQVTGAQFNFVSFKSGAAAVNDLLGGNADFAIQDIPETIQLVKAHKIRALAVMSSKRIADLPNVPTVKQEGFNVSFETPRGFALMSGASAAATTFWDKTCSAVFKSPAYGTYGHNNGLDMRYLGGSAALAFYKKTYQSLTPVFKSLGFLHS